LRFGAAAALLAAACLIFTWRADAAGARFVFLFIGDGMGAAQRNAAEIYMAGMRISSGDAVPREYQLAMNSLPVSGMIRTDSLSGTTDSAAAGTAIATGRRTTNGAVAMNPDSGEKFVSIATLAHERGMRVGIVTSSFLQDATPAVFYGHAKKRTEHASLGLQLVESGFEYFAGGGFRRPSGGSGRDPVELAKLRGYRIIRDEAGLRSLGPGESAIAIHPGISAGMMPWAIDEKPGPSLADFVRAGIRLLDGEGGFFMMVEGGKIDLACHANDAAAAVREVMAFDEAVGAALEFQAARPDETLVVVTSDHETGGMSLQETAWESLKFYGLLSGQRGSHQAFERTVSPSAKSSERDGITRAQKFFGPAARATDAVRMAWKMSMTAKDKRPAKSAEYKKLYGPYDPFTMACMREMNASAGVTWRTFYHTGADVPVSAYGPGSESFAGEYGNTGIFDRLRAAMSL
jgi:alkaline phosphatase